MHNRHLCEGLCKITIFSFMHMSSFKSGSNTHKNEIRSTAPVSSKTECTCHKSQRHRSATACTKGSNSCCNWAVVFLYGKSLKDKMLLLNAHKPKPNGK